MKSPGSVETFGVGLYSAPLFRRCCLGGGVDNQNLWPSPYETIMPKQKTHKGIKKRFTVTASGKAKHRKAFRGHLLSGKSGKRKRNLRQDGVLENYQAKTVLEALRPIL